MTRGRLSGRGPNANAGTKLPGLQAARSSEPVELYKSLEALREWVETRLGSRGDKYEKAVTLREFEQRLADVFDKVTQLKNFDGSISSLRADEFDALPTSAPAGSFTLLSTGDLYFGTGKEWMKVTLTAIP